MQKRIVTYHEFGELLNKLTNKLNQFKFDYVYGPSRGGLPIAVHLSHHLDIDMVDTEFINWSIFNSNYNILIVDDIIDTGRTVNYLRDMLGKSNTVTTACLFKRPGIENPLFIEETADWVIFPWETVDEKPSQYHQEIYPDLVEGEKDEV